MHLRSRVAALAALAAVAAAAALLLLVLPPLLGWAGGAAPEVATVLRAAGAPPVRLAVPGSALVLVGRSLNFERVTVSEEPADRARAVSTLDFEGTLGAVRVSSLGRETTRFRRRGQGWELDGSLAPTLAAAVGVLAARARALEAADGPALAALIVPADRERALADPELRSMLAAPRPMSIQAWLLRSEAGEITVTEQEGQPPGARRLRLVPSGPGSREFVFAGSLL